MCVHDLIVAENTTDYCRKLIRTRVCTMKYGVLVFLYVHYLGGRFKMCGKINA